MMAKTVAALGAEVKIFFSIPQMSSLTTISSASTGWRMASGAAMLPSKAKKAIR